MREPVHVHVTDAEVEAVVSACRVLIAVARRSAAPGTVLADPAALRVLIAAGGAEAAVPELAATAGLTPWAMQKAVSRLADAGLVERDASAVRLTEAGRQVADEAVQRRRDALLAVLDRLPAALRIELAAMWAGAAASAEDEPVTSAR